MYVFFKSNSIEITFTTLLETVDWGGAEPASSHNNYFNSVLIREEGFLRPEIAP